MHFFHIFLIVVEFCSFEMKELSIKFYQISTKDLANIFFRCGMLRETTAKDFQVKPSLELP